MRFSIAITVLLLSVICRATFSTRFLTPPNEIQPLIVTPKFQMQLILKTNHKPDLPCDLQLNRTIFHDTRVILVPKLTVFTPKFSNYVTLTSKLTPLLMSNDLYFSFLAFPNDVRFICKKTQVFYQWLYAIPTYYCLNQPTTVSMGHHFPITSRLN